MKRIMRRARSAAEMRFETVRPAWLEKLEVRLRRRQPQASTVSGTKRLFVDVSVIAESDAGTGIQRVVRGILRHVTELAGDEWRVLLVRATRNQRYQLVTPVHDLAPEMEARPGDVFLGLDYSLDAVIANQRQLARFRHDGGTLWFLVHDLLPLQRPDWFSRHTALRYSKWLRALAVLGDGFFCNSLQTEAELRQALAERYGLENGFRTWVLPMGTDLVSGEQRLVPSGASLEQLRNTRYILMVGTLEPRKGHEEILTAFERLWPKDDLKLVIVGRPGWKTEALQARIRTHPMLGNKLHWLSNASDDTLELLFSHCQGVIVAAMAEGYGLPLVEALGYGKPVLARDIPIFRQHESRGVWYFPAKASTEELAEAIERWINAIESNLIEILPPTETWHSTTKSLLAALNGGGSERE
jgi:glycosyltransferase involved in cell wall biosynthesis